MIWEISFNAFNAEEKGMISSLATPACVLCARSFISAGRTTGQRFVTVPQNTDTPRPIKLQGTAPLLTNAAAKEAMMVRRASGPLKFP